jgi:hypothetical protein
MQSPASSAAAPWREGTDGPRWPAILYGLIALAAVAFAFVGLSTSSYWIDELFTVYLVDPHVDLAQRMQRILRDVHPPLYYLALHGWADAFGRSEAALRAFSALCASLALLVFAAGVRRIARPAAIAFACAVAATSTFWFEQAQNARNYAWVMLLASALLAIALQLRRRLRESARFPFAAWLLLTFLGAAASLSHSYLLLATGMLLAYLIATLPQLRLRVALALSGVAILAAYLVFAWFQLHAMERDFATDWFGSDLAAIGRHLLRALGGGLSLPAAVVVVALLAVPVVRRGGGTVVRTPEDANWAAGLAAFVIVGGVAGGVAVTKLFVPSFSFRNVLTFAPFGWLLLARLYDAAGPRAATWRGAVAAILIASALAVSQIALAPGRFLQRNEPWRASAADVLAQASCHGAIPAVILPEAYSGQEADLRWLAERHYHGYYVPQRRVAAFTPAELLRRYEAAGADPGADGCALLAWGVRGFGEARAVTLAMALANLPAARAQGVAVHEFPLHLMRGLSWRKRLEGFVFVMAGREAPRSPVQDRIVVTRIDEASPPDTATFLIRTWHDGRPMREERAVVPLATLEAAPLRDWRRSTTAADTAPAASR